MYNQVGQLRAYTRLKLEADQAQDQYTLRNEQGFYLFADLEGQQTYGISPDEDGLDFTPASRGIFLAANETGVNFWEGILMNTPTPRPTPTPTGTGTPATATPTPTPTTTGPD